MIAIGSVADLNLWRAKTAPPWVIKADGTWGGRGVRLSRNADEALRDWQDLSLRPSPAGTNQTAEPEPRPWVDPFGLVELFPAQYPGSVVY